MLIRFYEYPRTQSLRISLPNARGLIGSNDHIARVEISKDLLKKNQSKDCMATKKNHASFKCSLDFMNTHGPNRLGFHFPMPEALWEAMITSLELKSRKICSKRTKARTVWQRKKIMLRSNAH